jgi:hypothetical protein
MILNFADKAYKARGKKLTDEKIYEALNPIVGERTDEMVKSYFEEIEARGETRYKADMLWRGLHRKFTNAPKRIEAAIRQISDPRKLESLMDYFVESRTLDEFEAALK